MNIIIAMDSYKGCMSAVKCCDVIEKALYDTLNDCNTYKYPMADGGEGTVDCLVLAAKGHIEYIPVQGVLGEEMVGSYGVLGDGKTAVIESACASGIQSIPRGHLNPMKASSYGTGQLIRAALEKGYEKLIIGFGGTASSDGGMGALAALGMLFYDKDKNILQPSGAAMAQVDSIDASNVLDILNQTDIVFACDVENVYHGKKGAAYVFAPQKGASQKDVVDLDNGLKTLAGKFEEYLGKDISSIKCSGAAGGLVGGLMTICSPSIQSGFDVILNYTPLEQAIRDSDIVITGEGRTDAQTAYGKLVMRVGMLSKKYDKPVICISGAVTKDAEILKNHGITAMFAISRGPLTLQESLKQSKSLLYLETINIAGLLGLL